MGYIFSETAPRAWHFGVEDFHHFWEKHVENADSSRAIRGFLRTMDITKGCVHVLSTHHNENRGRSLVGENREKKQMRAGTLVGALMMRQLLSGFIVFHH